MSESIDTPLRVFISYGGHDDPSFVRRLYADLTAQGFDVWFDKESLHSRQRTFHSEILDAICTRTDRVVYVAGPHARQSQYVAGERALALKRDLHVVSIHRLGDLNEVLPIELAGPHCHDFRDDAAYDGQLKKLVADLRAPAPSLGALHGVPALPARYLPRADLCSRLCDALNIRVVHDPAAAEVSRSGTHVGLWGMGGIGKTTTAAAVASSLTVRRAFPDGVLWVSLEKKPDIRRVQAELAISLGHAEPMLQDTDTREVLRSLLLDKATLLVLDNVWHGSVVSAFSVLGPRGRILVTTRNADALLAEPCTTIEVDLLSEHEALQLLATTASGPNGDPLPSDTLPPEASEVIRECGRLPLAIELCGGMACEGATWRELLATFRRSALRLISDRRERDDGSRRRTLWSVMLASVKRLGDARKRRRFAELAVFSRDAPVPEAAVATLWHHTGGLGALETAALLREFAARCLIRLDLERAQPGSETTRSLSIHDVLHDCAVRLAGKPASLHASVVDAYAARCEGSWANGPEDGYFFEHLVAHMVGAGREDDANKLLLDYSWIAAKYEACGIAASLAEYDAFREDVMGGPARTRWPGLKRLQRALHQSTHVLGHTHTERRTAMLLATQLLGRLQHRLEPDLMLLCNEARRRLCGRGVALRPLTASLHSSRALLRTIECKDAVRSLVVSRGGDVIVAHDDVVAVWDADITRERVRIPVPGWHDAMATLDTVHRVVLAGSRLTQIDPDLGKAEHVANCTSRTTTIIAIDDATLAMGRQDSTLLLWDSRAASQLELGRHDERINALASPHPHLLVSGSDDKTIRLWHLDGREWNSTVLMRHTHAVCALEALSIQLVAMGAWDGTVAIWNVRSGVCEHTFKSGGAVSRLKRMRNGSLVVGLYSGDLFVWDPRKAKVVRTLSGHTQQVVSLVELHDGRLVSGSLDRTLKIWDCAEDDDHVVDRERHRGWVRALAAHANGQLFSGGSDGMVKIWNPREGRCTASFGAHSRGVDALALSLDGRLISTGADLAVKIWQAPGFGRSTWRMEAERARERGPRAAIASLPAGWIAWSSARQRITLWQPRDELEYDLATRCHSALLAALPDDRLVVGGDDILETWNLAITHASEETRLEPQIRSRGPGPDLLNALVVLPDGTAACAQNHSSCVELWNPETPRRWELRGHERPVTALAVLPGNMLASASEDNTVRLWSRNEGDYESVVAFVADAPLTSLAFVSASSILCAGDETGMIHFLELVGG